MTACAMTVGMVPMALALEKGSQMQAPLGLAVIGGLVMSTFATLLVVPSIFAVVVGKKVARSPSIYPDDPESAHYDPNVYADHGPWRPRGDAHAADPAAPSDSHADDERPRPGQRPHAGSRQRRPHRQEVPHDVQDPGIRWTPRRCARTLTRARRPRCTALTDRRLPMDIRSSERRSGRRREAPPPHLEVPDAPRLSWPTVSDVSAGRPLAPARSAGRPGGAGLRPRGQDRIRRMTPSPRACR